MLYTRGGGSGQGGYIGLGDNLACDQSAAPQGLHLLLGLHSNTKSAARNEEGLVCPEAPDYC